MKQERIEKWGSLLLGVLVLGAAIWGLVSEEAPVLVCAGGLAAGSVLLIVGRFLHNKNYNSPQLMTSAEVCYLVGVPLVGVGYFIYSITPAYSFLSACLAVIGGAILLVGFKLDDEGFLTIMFMSQEEVRERVKSFGGGGHH